MKSIRIVKLTGLLCVPVHMYMWEIAIGLGVLNQNPVGL